MEFGFRVKPEDESNNIRYMHVLLKGTFDWVSSRIHYWHSVCCYFEISFLTLIRLNQMANGCPMFGTSKNCKIPHN